MYELMIKCINEQTQRHSHGGHTRCHRNLDRHRSSSSRTPRSRRFHDPGNHCQSSSREPYRIAAAGSRRACIDALCREPRTAPRATSNALRDGQENPPLFREGDEADLQRTGRITPEPESIPARYRYLLDWYSNEYSKLANQPPQGAWLRGVMELSGAGREIFAGIDPDGYVHKLRRGWQ